MRTVWTLTCEGCQQRRTLRRWYLRCFECGHVYRTRWHLLGAYWREMWTYSRIFPKGYSLPRLIVNTWRRPGKIYFCQCCLHDF